MKREYPFQTPPDFREGTFTRKYTQELIEVMPDVLLFFQVDLDLSEQKRTPKKQKIAGTLPVIKSATLAKPPAQKSGFQNDIF